MFSLLIIAFVCLGARSESVQAAGRTGLSRASLCDVLKIGLFAPHFFTTAGRCSKEKNSLHFIVIQSTVKKRKLQSILFEFLTTKLFIYSRYIVFSTFHRRALSTGHWIIPLVTICEYTYVYIHWIKMNYWIRDYTKAKPERVQYCHIEKNPSISFCYSVSLRIVLK